MAAKRQAPGHPRRPTTQKAGKAQDIAARRHEVFRLLRSGMRQVRIAEQLGVSEATVSIDVKLVMQDLRADTMDEAKAYQGLAKARLEALYERYEEAALSGNLDAARICLGVIDRWCRVMGVDQPQRLEVTGPDGQPVVSVQALQAFVQRVEGGGGDRGGD